MADKETKAPAAKKAPSKAPAKKAAAKKATKAPARKTVEASPVVPVAPVSVGKKKSFLSRILGR